MKKNLIQLIDILNEKLAVQSATIRHLNNELTKYQKQENPFNRSLFDCDIEETVTIWNEQYTILQRSRAVGDIHLCLKEEIPNA